MTISTIDAKTALIVVDLQKGIARFPTVHPMADVVKQASALLKTFRRLSLPVVLVNAVGMAPGRSEQGFRSLADMPSDWAEFMPELNQQASDILVSKRTWGSFTNTALHEQLQKLGVTQVVVVGVATSFGVESTARQAHELGYNVTLAIDAMTDMNLDAHTNSITRIFPRLGETGTVDEIVNTLAAKKA
jgi:nicotinamidase-related amidase